MQRGRQLNKQNINFVIAHERPDGSLESYSFAGEVKFDTLKAAKEYCRYAQNQWGTKTYRVYGLVKIDL